MKHLKPTHILIFLGIVLPLVVIEYFSYRQFEAELMKELVADRTAVVSLSATILKERFDRVKEVAISLSTRVRFRFLIKQGRWEDAMAILYQVPRDFPFVDRIFIADTAGTLMADYPPLPDVRGRNFAFRDWYTGTRAGWTPYLSEVYQRAAAPQINVVTISCAIRESGGENVIGILVVQISLETLLDWIKEIKVGNAGILYAIDHTGTVAAHPRYDPQAGLIDYSDRSVTQAARNGDPGVRILRDHTSDQMLLTAFAPVQGYGWTVIAEEREDLAFEAQNATLRTILFIYSAMLFLTVVLAFAIIRIVAENQRAREEIQTLNNNLKQRAQQLEEANRDLEGFSYSVSHDLRAPLRHIDGFAQLLQTEVAGKLDHEGKRFISVIIQSTERMNRLIDDLLMFSRMGRTEMRTVSIPMDALVQEVLGPMNNDVRDRGIRLSVDSMPVIKGDPSMMRQVWVNLISNALKYTGKTPQPVIEIRHKLENGEHVFSVSDNGAGFDMQYAGKLFGVFQRLHGIEEFEGTGIGLAIVQRIVHRHNGRVWAEGAIGKGAAFFFVLPNHSP